MGLLKKPYFCKRLLGKQIPFELPIVRSLVSLMDASIIKPYVNGNIKILVNCFYLRNIKKINYPAGLLYAHKLFVTNCRLTQSRRAAENERN
ncbi:hypothetical protein BGS_0122 [Beggiatoa sp. SS]|nr:hypothetical protein BGS_0122 [Beggiatoa sp. SS]